MSSLQRSHVSLVKEVAALKLQDVMLSLYKNTLLSTTLPSDFVDI